MIRAYPGTTRDLPLNNAPSGKTFGVQILDVSTDPPLVKVARSEANIFERPVGSGIYTAADRVMPVQSGTYKILWDDNAGALGDGHTASEDLIISVQLTNSELETLSLVAQRAQSFIPETFNALFMSEHYGPAKIQERANVIKRRIIGDPTIVAGDDSALDEMVLDYLAKLTALELIPPGRDYWSNQLQSQSIGNDPVEMQTYPNRISSLGDVQSDLLRQTMADAALVATLIPSPRLVSTDEGPGIDEDDDCRETFDPREFSEAMEFATHRRQDWSWPVFGERIS